VSRSYLTVVYRNPQDYNIPRSINISVMLKTTMPTFERLTRPIRLAFNRVYVVSVAVDVQVNPVLRATRLGACLAKQRLHHREQANLQKLTKEQEKSERLLGKEKTNG
jgi:hypothetical protein